MRKIVINCDYGGFGLSNEAFEEFLKRKGIAYEKVFDKKYEIMHYYQSGHANDSEFYLSPCDFYENRDDENLVAVVEEMGDLANGNYSSLKIVEIPDDVKWHIGEYDGSEWVAEDHRKWY